MAGNWQQLRLREANVTLIDCDHRTPSAADAGYPYVAIPQLRNGRIDLSDARRITPEHFLEWTRKAKPTAHDVVLSRRCNPGETAFVPPDLEFALGQNLVLLRADGTKVYPPFLRWLVQGPQWWEQIGKFLNVGAVFDSLRCADVPDFQLLIPPLDEQRAIARILGTLDDKIELNRRMNKTLEAIARALFKSWFVDFDPVRAKAEGREPGLSKPVADLFPDSFGDSDLGEIPTGWTTARLGDVVSVVDFVANGSFASLKKNVRLLNAPGYAMLLRTTDHNKGFSGGFRFVSQDAYDFLSKSALDGSEVIISNVGDVGTVFRPPSWLGWPMTLGSNAVALKSQSLNQYIFHYFSSPVGQDAIRSILTGSAQPKFNKTNLRDLRILMPSMPIVELFERQTAALVERNNSTLRGSKTLTALRDTLLPKLISGELRVKDAEHFVEATV